jgi:hypothetical protein
MSDERAVGVGEQLRYYMEICRGVREIDRETYERARKTEVPGIYVWCQPVPDSAVPNTEDSDG